MTTYVCPEFAATGIELQLIELQVRRDEAASHGQVTQVATLDQEIAGLWAELARLAELYPDSVSTGPGSTLAQLA